MTLVVGCLLAACSQKEAPQSEAPAAISVIPAPATVTMNRGAFELTSATPVRYSAGSPGEQVANYFVDLMKRTRGVALAASAGETGGEQAISFVLQAREGSQAEEAYSLLVSPERIVVSSPSPRGLFYGAVTLWQLAAGMRAFRRSRSKTLRACVGAACCSIRRATTSRSSSSSVSSTRWRCTSSTSCIGI